MIKVYVTIWDSSCKIDEDDWNFVAFIALKSIEVSPTTTFKARKLTKEYKDGQDKLLDTYNE